MTPPFTFTNQVELFTTLRHLRVQRDQLKEELVKLEEKIRTGYDGPARDALLVAAADLSILEEVIRRMWEAYSGVLPKGPRP